MNSLNIDMYFKFQLIFENNLRFPIFLQKGITHTHTKCIKAFCTWKIPFFSLVFLYFCYRLYSMFISLLYPPSRFLWFCWAGMNISWYLSVTFQSTDITLRQKLGNDIFVRGRTYTHTHSSHKQSSNILFLFFYVLY